MLTVGNVSSFGNGPVNFTSGTLATSVAPPTNSQFGYFALANPFNFNNSVVTFQSSVNRIFLTGPITLTGNNQITADANAFGATGFSGVVSGTGSLNLLGGAIVMQNPNNTYSGGTNLGSGNLIVTASDTIATATIAASPTGATESGSLVTITALNTFAAGQTVSISGVGASGYNGVFTIASANSTSFTYTDPTTGLTASGGGTATVVVNGPLGTGALNLGGASTSGILQASATNVPDLAVNAITLHNALTLSNASVIVAGGSALNAGAGGNITLAGPVTLNGTNTVTITDGFNFTISGNISNAAGSTGGLVKTGAGALLLSGTNTFSGGVTATATAGNLGNVGNLIVGSNTVLNANGTIASRRAGHRSADSEWRHPSGRRPRLAHRCQQRLPRFRHQ